MVCLCSLWLCILVLLVCPYYTPCDVFDKPCGVLHCHSWIFSLGYIWYTMASCLTCMTVIWSQSFEFVIVCIIDIVDITMVAHVGLEAGTDIRGIWGLCFRLNAVETFYHWRQRSVRHPSEAFEGPAPREFIFWLEHPTFVSDTWILGQGVPHRWWPSLADLTLGHVAQGWVHLAVVAAMHSAQMIVLVQLYTCASYNLNWADSAIEFWGSGRLASNNSKISQQYLCCYLHQVALWGCWHQATQFRFNNFTSKFSSRRGSMYCLTANSRSSMVLDGRQRRCKDRLNLHSMHLLWISKVDCTICKCIWSPIVCLCICMLVPHAHSHCIARFTDN